MSSPPKNYKIIVDSKHFGNIKGIRPAEVAKKAASKILCLSNNRNRITKFSMVETKNGKIRNYKAFKENLIRPYKKKGKLITYRIIVKKIGKHTGGEPKNLSEIYKKEKFTEEDIKKIKDEMFIENIFIEGTKTNYDPYNLTEKNKALITQGNEAGYKSADFLYLGENDPILQFFPISEFKIGFDLSDDGGSKMILNYTDKDGCNIFYEFTGDEDSFKLHIYNLSSCFDYLTKDDAAWLVLKWKDYIKFLRKLYPRADISFDFYYNVPYSNNNRNNHVRVGHAFYSHFKNKPILNSNNDK